MFIQWTVTSPSQVQLMTIRVCMAQDCEMMTVRGLDNTAQSSLLLMRSSNFNSLMRKKSFGTHRKM